MQTSRSSPAHAGRADRRHLHRQHQQLRRAAAPDRRGDERLLRPWGYYTSNPDPAPPAARALGDRRPRGRVGAVAHVLHVQSAGDGGRRGGTVTGRAPRLAVLPRRGGGEHASGAGRPVGVWRRGRCGFGAAGRADAGRHPRPRSAPRCAASVTCGALDYRVDGREVTLTGEVPTLWDKTRAIDRVLELDGVDVVASELTIPAGEERPMRSRRPSARRFDSTGTTRSGTTSAAGSTDGVVTLNGSGHARPGQAGRAVRAGREDPRRPGRGARHLPASRRPAATAICG